MLNERLIQQAFDANASWMLDYDPADDDFSRMVEELELGYEQMLREQCERHHGYNGYHSRPFSDNVYFEVFKYEGWWYWSNAYGPPHHEWEHCGPRHGPYYSAKEAYVNGFCEGD